jgi:hypothetical protein
MNLKNHLNQQYPAVFIMALTIFDFKKDMSCPTSELRRFFYPTVEIVPKKRIGTTVSRGFGTTMAGW